MKYIIEIELPDNDTIREGITYEPVVWAWGGYSGHRRAIPAPKGKWIIQRGCEEVIVLCSNCGAKDYIPTTIDGRFYFNRNYCWDCGAKMEKE